MSPASRNAWHAFSSGRSASFPGLLVREVAHLRLAEEQFAQLGARLQALADECRELSDPSLPDASLVFALFHPAQRKQAEGGAE